MKTSEKYYRKEGLCIFRKTETTGIQVQIPDTPKGRLPLSMTQLTFPSKERFDETVDKMDEVNEEIFNDYIKTFCGRVEIDINRPMQETSIKKLIAQPAPKR